MKVLVAEDDSVSSMVLATRLRKMGHEVITAENGKEAWFSFVRSHPRLVITDWMMPHMDGRTLAAQLRKERPTLRVLFVSGYSEGASASGEGRVLAKPYRLDDIAREVRSVLDE